MQYLIRAVFLIIICFLLTDLWIHGKTWLFRIKIGRWKEERNWEQAVKQVAERWMAHMPAVKETDQARLMLLDILKGNYANRNIQSWQIGGLYLGLTEHEIDSGKRKAYQQKYIDENGNWKTHPQEVDEGLLAYAILRRTEEPLDIRPAMDEMYRLIMDRVQQEDQCACYRKSVSQVRFVDTIGFICPFLELYNKRYDVREASELAKRQIQAYAENGLLGDQYIPVHAYSMDGKLPLGIYGWGRGAGWWMLGILDVYREAPAEYLAKIIRRTADCLIDFQNQAGGFAGNIFLKNNTESSATAIAAYFYMECAVLFHEERYKVISMQCKKALMKNTRRNGEIDFSQGDTKGIGMYSSTYDIMPFTQGIMLRCIELQ